MIDTAKTASVWVMLGIGTAPTMQEAHTLLQILALVLAILMSAQQLAARSRKARKEETLSSILGSCKDSCTFAAENNCPLEKHIQKMES